MKALLLAVLALGSFATAAAAGNCSVNTPVNLFGQNGGNGLLTNKGTPGFDSTGAVGQIAAGGGMGTANLHGSADCPVFDPSDVMALSAALSTPVWLEAGEKFAISGGVGFTDGASALGMTGLMRFDKNWSGFAGAAISTDDSDIWAGKVGLRFGW